jgi:hypothetical protein
MLWAINMAYNRYNQNSETKRFVTQKIIIFNVNFDEKSVANNPCHGSVTKRNLLMKLYFNL